MARRRLVPGTRVLPLEALLDPAGRPAQQVAAGPVPPICKCAAVGSAPDARGAVFCRGAGVVRGHRLGAAARRGAYRATCRALRSDLNRGAVSRTCACQRQKLPAPPQPTSLLAPKDRARLDDILLHLSMERPSIAEGMLFALDHVEAADEVRQPLSRASAVVAMKRAHRAATRFWNWAYRFWTLSSSRCCIVRRLCRPRLRGSTCSRTSSTTRPCPSPTPGSTGQGAYVVR